MPVIGASAIREMRALGRRFTIRSSSLAIMVRWTGDRMKKTYEKPRLMKREKLSV